MENNELEVKQDNKKVSKKKNKILLIVIIILIIAILSVLVYLSMFKEKEDKSSSGDNKKVETENIVKSEYRIYGNSLEKFDLAFLQLENEKTNKVYSPLSIKYALEMLGEGSKGTSKSQIDSVIGDYVAKKYTNSSNMSFANALYIRDSYKNNIKNDYTNTLSSKYNAEVVYDSFATANNLNRWVSDKTFNLIDNLYDNVDDKDFVLINALAIDMEWVNKIQSDHDDYYVKYNHENFSAFVGALDGVGYHSLDFNNFAQKAKSVEIGAAINKYDIVNTLGEDNIRQAIKTAYEEYLAKDPCGSAATEPDADTYVDQYIEDINANYKQISSSTDFYFYDDTNVKVFAKDLKEYDGTTLQYIGIMPKSVSLDNYIKNTDVTKISTIINNLKGITLENFDDGVITKITGYIPMFKFEYDLKLKNDLESLGITDVFDSEKADLSGLTTDKNSYIDSASHKSNIEFSNEGIKAAAVTTAGGKGDAYCGFQYNYDVPVKEINLTFDNPYLFLIRDKNSGEVWFAGTVYEPIEQ